jgi:hypothetical protein
MNNEIHMPIAKASSAIAAAVAAKSDVADSVVQTVTIATGANQTMVVINSIPWGNIASMAAVFYTLLLITEWFWKKFWRPLFVRQGWMKPQRHRIITIEEFEQFEQDANADAANLAAGRKKP